MLSNLLKKKPIEETTEKIEYIDRFELLDKLGKGAQGIVYLANDVKLNRQVAVKTLLHKNKDGEQIFNEAKSVSSLQHPNIIPLYEIGTHNEKPFLVYPYVKGKSLREYMDETGKLTVIKATEIISSVLDGLVHAHEKGVIHRDLNPSNILIDENDKPRIMDFGISTFTEHNTGDTNIVGTVNYMAPEQLNNKPVGAWSDVFSIGIMFFEMLTGHSLFKADNSMVSIYKIMNENILAPSTRNSAIDKTLDLIVLKSLAKEKENRYQSAIEMKEALDAYMHVETSDEITNTNWSTDDLVVREQATMLLLKKSLDKNKDFPVMGNSIVHMMQVNEGQDCAEKLAEIILRDQSLSSKILGLVNSSNYGQFGGEIKTISRAVVILGLGQIKTMSMSIMIFEKLNNGPMAETMKSNTCQSFLSAVFAKKLAGNLSTVDAEEAFLASMFHNLGKQIIIYFLPDEYNEILNLVIEKGIEEDKASKRILGTNFACVGRFIASEWQLPQNIIQGIQPRPQAITQKPLKMEEYLAQISSLTNEIVQAAACGNNEQAERELKNIIKRYKISFSLNYEKIIHILEFLYKELVSYCEALGINQNKNTFCKNFISFIKHDYEFIEDDSDDVAELPETSVNKKGFHEATLTYGIAKITGIMFKQYDLPEVLNIVVNTLQRGLESEHAIIIMKDSVNGEMRSQAGAGNDISNVMARFHFYNNPNNDDIFSVAMQKQTDIFIPDVVHSPLLKKIPDWCKKVTLPKNLLIYPVCSQKRCIGLLYIDNARVLSSKSKDVFEYIDTLRKQTAIAIKQKT
ncbi:MAG: HDOD domain-containing protein [Proteobacteria bacterium]|nr:HDOD domain-containing protein [Pseudomonadota bacterium]NOG61194.1 HDOD domain-containing protein [Pseudomonadota bacterium]